MDAVKGLFRSIKLICTLVFHSIHCSMIFRRVKWWSMHPTPDLKLPCSFFKMVLMASLSLIWMILQKILRGTERSVTPRQLLHCVLSAFLGSLMISSLHQSSGMVSAFQILWNRSYNRSVSKRMSFFNTSGVMLSIPAALLFFRLLIAFRISFFVGGEQAISSLSPKGWDIQARSAGSSLLRTSLKCSAHLCTCLSSILSLHRILPGIFQRGPLLFCTTHFAPPLS